MQDDHYTEYGWAIWIPAESRYMLKANGFPALFDSRAEARHALREHKQSAPTYFARAAVRSVLVELTPQ